VYERCILGFNAGPPIIPGGDNQNIELIQTRRNFKLSGQDRLRVEESHARVLERVQRVMNIFRDLTRSEGVKAKAG